MRVSKQFCVGCALGLLLHGTSMAHEGVTWPLPQVPDPALITIDGNDDDWDWFDPHFVLEQGDFFDREMFAVDAADYDFTLKVAWSPPPDNCWYVFMRISDDTLKVEYDDPLKWWQDDSVQITVDADHSGGSIYGFEREELVNGQRLYARAVPSPGQLLLPNRRAGFMDQHTDPYMMEFVWIMEQPYYEIDWQIQPEEAGNGSTHVSYTFEWKAAMWDTLGASPEESIRHVFEAWDVVHIGFRMLDADRPGGGRKHSMYLRGGHPYQDRNADRMPDFLAVPVGYTKAIADSIWSRVINYDDGRRDPRP